MDTMMQNIEKKIGLQLKKIRLSKNLTQEQLAELSSLHRTYIGSIERGERNITVKNLNKILVAMDYTFLSFFKDF